MADPTTLGPYEIIELVRRGRSADSFLAHHGKMRLKRVLLRVLHEDVTEDAVFMQHFVAEAKAAAKLQHDCIASVIDLETESRPVYTVLEFVEGMDLAGMLESFGPAPPEVAASIACEVCRGLAYAHEAAVLHRRLRPRLIKVTPEGRVKILGFGVREQQSMVQPTAMILDVTHEEMFRSPEQVREETEAPASDVYSLGVILFELLCGQMPFASLASYVSGEAAIRTPPRLRERNPLVPPRLAGLVERMLAPVAADRPAGAAEVRRELESLLEDRGDSPGPDLLQAYLGNPPDYAASARRRTIAEVMERASQLSRGLVAERAAALKELELLLTVEPGYPAATALARQLRAAAPPVEVDEMSATRIMPPPEADDPLATRILPPPEADDPLATRILPPPEADDPLATRILPPEQAPVRVRPMPVKPPPRPVQPPPPPHPAPPAPPPPLRQARPPVGPAVPVVRPSGRSPWPIVLVVLALGAAAGGVMLSRGCQNENTGVVAVTPPASSAPAAPTGSLVVSSLPPGARVEIGDVHVSFLTDSTLAAVASGTHALHVERAGFLPRDTSVTVVAGQEARMVLRLAPAPVQAVLCSLFVRVKPGANRVLVDSLPAAGGPELFARAVAAGKHRLTVQAEGFVTSSQVVAVPGAPRQTLVVVLQPSPPEKPDTGGDAGTGAGASVAHGSGEGTGVPMVVNVKPASDVFVDDGKVASHVTTTTVSLAAGEQHKIRFENPDFVSVTRTVKVKPGSALKPLSVDLTAGEGGLFVTGPRQGLKIYLDDHFTGKTTPDRVVARAGAHDVSVREADGTTIVASKRVIVDPDKPGGIRIEFGR